MNPIGTVLVTGGAGYVGSVLVPRLLLQNYTVKVLDLYLFGDHVLASVKNKLNLKEIKGDIRDQALVEKVVKGTDAVIHLAARTDTNPENTLKDYEINIKDLKINGLDVMRELNISPGPLVGKILNDLFDGVDLGKIPNDREILLGRLRETKIN